MTGILHGITYIAIDTMAKNVTETNDANDFSDSMHLISLGGILQGPQRFLLTNHSDVSPTDLILKDIVDCGGEWSALLGRMQGDKTEYLFLGDPSGFAPLYYSLIPGRALVVSDSFSGAVQGLGRLGISPTLNIGNYLTQISGLTTTFDNMVSTETMANEIKLLGHKEALSVDSSSVACVSRRTLSKVNFLDGYEKVLDAGIEYSAETVKTLLASDIDFNAVLTLTGGVDSRLILALLNSADLSKEFKIWTMDPRDWKSPNKRRVYTADVEIANELRRLHGLQWMPPRKREMITVDFPQALAFHQSYRSNFGFNFSDRNHILRDLKPILTLRGGGGEILRGGGGARLMGERYAAYRSEGGALEQVRWAAQDYLKKSRLSASSHDIVTDFMVQSLSLHMGSLMRERIDSFYQSTRNRAHFGHARLSFAGNEVIFQALANPYFLRAIELTDYEHRSNAGVVRDLFHRTDRKLLKLPFEDPVATGLLSRRARDQAKFKDRNGWSSAFDSLKLEAEKSKIRIGDFSGKDHQKSPKVSKAIYRDFIAKNFELISESVSEDFRRILQGQHSLMLEEIDKGTAQINSLISKVASARDVYYPMSLSSEGSHYFTGPRNNHSIPISNELYNSSSNYRISGATEK